MDKNVVKEQSVYVQDYIAQLKILLEAEDKIMQRGIIYPAIEHITNAIKDTQEAIKEQVLIDSGIDKEVKKLIYKTSTNHFWDWNKDFLEWRKERGGVVNSKRKED